MECGSAVIEPHFARSEGAVIFHDISKHKEEGFRKEDESTVVIR